MAGVRRRPPPPPPPQKSTSGGEDAAAVTLPAVETALVVLALLATYALLLAIVVAPPVVMLDQRRSRPLPVLLYTGALACVAGRFLALDANMDEADRMGGAGSMLAGWHWVVLGAVLAVASVLVTLAKRRPARAQ
jgi:hypothetical protein